MSSSCILQGYRSECPICIHCPVPEQQNIDQTGVCLTCTFHCAPCPRFLDHQEVANHNDSLTSYFAAIPVPDLPEGMDYTQVLRGTVGVFRRYPKEEVSPEEAQEYWVRPFLNGGEKHE